MPHVKKRTRSCQHRAGMRPQHRDGHRTAEDGDGDGVGWLAAAPLIAAGAYCNSLAGDFVHDDVSAITANRDITDPSAGAWDFLYNDFWGTAMSDPTSHKSYRPLTILTFKWNYALTGLNSWSYHTVNVMLHAAVTWLLGWLCRRCLHLPTSASVLAACLFAVHPIHTEAVSGIVGRADVLAALFLLLSFISHDRATSGNDRRDNDDAGRGRLLNQKIIALRACSLVSALLALAAKENGIAALPVAATWDLIRLHQSSASERPSNRVKPKVPSVKLPTGYWWCLTANCAPILFSAAATFGLLAVRIGLLQRGQLPVFSEQDNPAAFASDKMARMLTLLYLPAFNMGLLLAPVLLSYDWQNGSIPLVEDWRDWRNFASLAFYASLAAGVAFSWLQRKRVMLWCIAVMVWPMLPASNLFYPCGFVVAERLLYLPSAGYCVMVAVGLHGAYQRAAASAAGRSRGTNTRRLVIGSCAVVLVAAFAAKTWTRNADWADRRTLFESGLRTLPNNAKMHYNYANVQKDDGRWEAAIHHYRQAIALWPDYASALNNLGTVLLARADELDDADDAKKWSVAEAEQRFRQAIRSHPQHVHARYNLAVVHMQRNETEQAVDLLKKCLVLNPKHREAARLLQWIESSEPGTEHLALRSLRVPIANERLHSGSSSASPPTPPSSSSSVTGSGSGKSPVHTLPSSGGGSQWIGANGRWQSRGNYRWNDTAEN